MTLAQDCQPRPGISEIIMQMRNIWGIGRSRTDERLLFAGDVGAASVGWTTTWCSRAERGVGQRAGRRPSVPHYLRSREWVATACCPRK
jgi:hypothetical protein